MKERRDSPPILLFFVLFVVLLVVALALTALDASAQDLNQDANAPNPQSLSQAAAAVFASCCEAGGQ